MARETYWFSVTILRETNKAWLVTDKQGEEVWIPKSQILDSTDGVLAEGQDVKVELPMWLAEKTELTPDD